MARAMAREVARIFFEFQAHGLATYVVSRAEVVPRARDDNDFDFIVFLSPGKRCVELCIYFATDDVHNIGTIDRNLDDVVQPFRADIVEFHFSQPLFTPGL